jgi:hypothetical protein
MGRFENAWQHSNRSAYILLVIFASLFHNAINMGLEVKRRFLHGFLLLATLFLAWSLLVSGKRSTFFSLNFVHIV